MSVDDLRECVDAARQQEQQQTQELLGDYFYVMFYASMNFAPVPSNTLKKGWCGDIAAVGTSSITIKQAGRYRFFFQCMNIGGANYTSQPQFTLSMQGQSITQVGSATAPRQADAAVYFTHEMDVDAGFYFHPLITGNTTQGAIYVNHVGCFIQRIG